MVQELLRMISNLFHGFRLKPHDILADTCSLGQWSYALTFLHLKVSA